MTTEQITPPQYTRTNELHDLMLQGNKPARLRMMACQLWEEGYRGVPPELIEYAELLEGRASTEQITIPRATFDAMREAQKKLIRAYVNLLESGRDRIIFLGGICDPVDKMVASDPALREAKLALSAANAVQPQAQGDQPVPFGYVNTHTGQFFWDVEDARKNNEGHWRTVYTHPHPTAPAIKESLTAPEIEESIGPKTWSEYVAGVIGCYLNEPVDSPKCKAISGIIERRMWVLPPSIKQSLTTPKGWRLVPEKHTPEMMHAATSAWLTRAPFDVVYSALLAAAPEQAGEDGA